MCSNVHSKVQTSKLNILRFCLLLVFISHEILPDLLLLEMAYRTYENINNRMVVHFRSLAKESAGHSYKKNEILLQVLQNILNKER